MTNKYNKLSDPELATAQPEPLTDARLEAIMALAATVTDSDIWEMASELSRLRAAQPEHGCHYCGSALDATALTSVYQCRSCLDQFPDAKPIAAQPDPINGEAGTRDGGRLRSKPAEEKPEGVKMPASPPISDPELAELDAAAVATDCEGPWFVGEDEDCEGRLVIFESTPCQPGGVSVTEDLHEDDAAYLAAADPPTIRALVARCLAAEGRCTEQAERIDGLEEQHRALDAYYNEVRKQRDEQAEQLAEAARLMRWANPACLCGPSHDAEKYGHRGDCHHDDDIATWLAAQQAPEADAAEQPCRIHLPYTCEVCGKGHLSNNGRRECKAGHAAGERTAAPGDKCVDCGVPFPGSKPEDDPGMCGVCFIAIGGAAQQAPEARWIEAGVCGCSDGYTITGTTARCDGCGQEWEWSAGEAQRIAELEAAATEMEAGRDDAIAERMEERRELLIGIWGGDGYRARIAELEARLETQQASHIESYEESFRNGEEEGISRHRHYRIKKLERQQARIVELKGLLREIEWPIISWHGYNGGSVLDSKCRSCGGLKDSGGHHPDCRLAVALKEEE